MKKLVAALEAFAVVAALVFAIMLFANEPSGGTGASAAQPGARLFQANCPSCHSADGSGGVGPKLAGRVVSRFPNIDDQIKVVTDGQNSMPSFSGTLSTAEIRQVVEYTRSGLGGEVTKGRGY